MRRVRRAPRVAGQPGCIGRDQRGVAMIEFALILPLLMLLYLGSVELTNALSCQRKLGATSRFVADAVSQSVVLEAAQLADVIDTAQIIMAPYPLDSFALKVSALQTGQNGTTTVVWSRALHAAPTPRNTAADLPADLGEGGRFLIRVETFYDIPKIGPLGLPFPIRLHDELFMAPRLSRTISCEDCT